MNPVTPERLTPIFAEHLGRDVGVTTVERGPVGNGQEVWFVDVDIGDDRFVLRRTAPGGPLEWTDRGREFEILVAVAAAGLPVPRVRWAEPKGGTLDGPYFVMDRMEGEPVRRVSTDVRAAVADDLGRWMARLHAAGIETESLGDMGATDAASATKAELAEWATRYRDDRPGRIPALGLLLAYLAQTAPGAGESAVLLWGDPGPHNALHHEGVVTGLLDWELSHFGDPHEDLGSLAWSYDDSDEFGIALAAYESEAGREMDLDRIRYFEVMACATRSVMLTNALAHYVSGRTATPNLAGLGLQLVPASLRRAFRLLGWSDGSPPELVEAIPQPNRSRPDVGDLLEGTMRFLRDQVLPNTADATLRRGLRTTEALLATAALQLSSGPSVFGDRRRVSDDLIAELAAGGVNTENGLEAAVIAVETDPAHQELRARVRSHLAEDVAAMGAMAGPLNDLYGA